jgi:hypothetical protein
MQIVYFPFISMGNEQEIDFGFLKIWNFDFISKKYIADPKLLSRVSKILSTNHAYFSGPVKGIGVVSIGNTDFRHYTQEESNLIRDARLILFLSFLAKHNAVRNDINAGHWFATTENFNFTAQNFEIDSDNMATRDGYIVDIMAGGYRMDRDKFFKPSYIASPTQFSIDENLFNSLLLLRDKKPRVFSKITRATELFSESYYNSQSVSINARILCQMGAFEMLLNLPEREQRKYFKDIVETETSFDKEKKYVYYYESRIGKKKQKESRTIKGIWADRFYTLRNHIIHGLKIPKEQYVFKKNQRHTDIALLFFIFLVKQQIEKGLRRKIFMHLITWETKLDELSDTSRQIFIYSSLQ